MRTKPGTAYRAPAGWVVALLALALLVTRTGAQPTGEPPNLAPLARVSATSEYSDGYQARFAVDGQIPMAMSHADVGKAWCVQGNTHRQGADFVLAVRDPGNEVSLDHPCASWIPAYSGQEDNILKIEPRTWGSPVSRLADIVLAGHPDAAGRPRVALSRSEQQRLLSWIDLNVPYYGTADTAYPEKQGCRRQYPEDLDRILAEVGQRRCLSCHRGSDGALALPRPRWTRITNPHLNGYLLAPLAREAGGTGTCGATVFCVARRSRLPGDRQGLRPGP